jgi:quinol monooxygenase YgiN
MLVRIDVKPEKGAAWPALIVEPRRAPEAGCTSYDPVGRRCAGVS